MKIYEITHKKNAKNVFGISLVATPAMESNYIKLSKPKPKTIKEKIELSKKHDINFAEINKEKRLLLGLVLEPEKLIYRYNEKTKEEYYITVSAETVLELSHDYIKNSNQNYSTIEHDGRELDGVSFVEHWIVEDSNIDKSALHGMNFAKGSWVSVAKIENDTLWNDYIETGRVMGFSIDARVQLQEVNLNKQTKMSETKTILGALSDLKKQIGLAFEPKKKEEEEEEKKKKELELAEPIVDTPIEEPVKEMQSLESVVSDLEKIKEVLAGMGVEFSTIVKDSLKPINDANLELTKQVDYLKLEVIELGKQPASSEIKTAPTPVDLSKLGELDRRRALRGSL